MPLEIIRPTLPKVSVTYAPPTAVDIHYGDDSQATQVELYAKNQTGATIPKGSVVYIAGASGANPLITLGQADSEAKSSKTVGITRDAIANGSHGYVVTSGVLANVDTSAVSAEGAALWLSPSIPGGFTSTKPSAPNHLVYLGVCLRKNQNNGVIQVHVVNGFEVNELHDVQIQNPVSGQTLVYNAVDKLWVNSASTTTTSTIYEDLPSMSLIFENGLV